MAMCLAFEGVSLRDEVHLERLSQSSQDTAAAEGDAYITPSTSSLTTSSSQLRSGSSLTAVQTTPERPTHRKNGIISSATFYPEYRLESTPASTPSSSPKSRDANLPPSPIPSFPPFTPKESPRHNHDSIAIEQTSGSSAVQVVGGPSSTMVLDPTVPGFFIVPSTCDKRRRDRDREGHDHELLDPLTGSRPMKKLKQANGRAVARDARSSTDSLPELIMPTAIDVVDFIDRKGGMCYEGDIFMRFRTGESEYVRSVINEIIVHFARVDVGRDGSRWVTLTPGIASGPMGLAEP